MKIVEVDLHGNCNFCKNYQRTQSIWCDTIKRECILGINIIPSSGCSYFELCDVKV